MLSGFVLGMGLKESFHLTGLSNLWIFLWGIFLFIHHILNFLTLELRSMISKDISTMPVPMLESLSRYIKLLLASTSDEEVSEKERDALFLASISGKWEDSRSADEMLNDIYASRTVGDDAELVSAF